MAGCNEDSDSAYSDAELGTADDEDEPRNAMMSPLAQASPETDIAPFELPRAPHTNAGAPHALAARAAAAGADALARQAASSTTSSWLQTLLTATNSIFRYTLQRAAAPKRARPNGCHRHWDTHTHKRRAIGAQTAWYSGHAVWQ